MPWAQGPPGTQESCVASGSPRHRPPASESPRPALPGTEAVTSPGKEVRHTPRWKEDWKSTCGLSDLLDHSKGPDTCSWGRKLRTTLSNPGWQVFLLGETCKPTDPHSSADSQCPGTSPPKVSPESHRTSRSCSRTRRGRQCGPAWSAGNTGRLDKRASKAFSQLTHVEKIPAG